MSIRIENLASVRVITIDRPAVRNAVDPATATALFEAFLDFEQDPGVRVAVLTGAGRSFCSGFDLTHARQGPDSEWEQRHAIPDDWTDPRAQPLPGPMGPTRLMLSKPVIAAIAGPAVAGGLELAAWCDLRVVEQSAYFGVYCRRWGIPLIDGGTVRLPALLGRGRAMDLILSGRTVDAVEALHMGLADRLAAESHALDEALELAADLADFPQACLCADRLSVHGSPALLAAALRREWASYPAFKAEGRKGAQLFAASLHEEPGLEPIRSV